METIHICFVDDRGWFVADIPYEEHIYYKLRKKNTHLEWIKINSDELKKGGEWKVGEWTVKDLVPTLGLGEDMAPRTYWKIIVQTDSGEQPYIVDAWTPEYDKINVYMRQQLEFLKSNRAPPPARDKRKPDSAAAAGGAAAGKRPRGARMIQFVQDTE